MAAGQGFKTFATGDVLSASDVNGYLMQGVLVFADATERNAEITSPQEGQFAYLKDTNVTTYYTGSAWANLDTTGMTNPMTTTGDTIYSSSGSTPARLGIGSTGQVLTVASGLPSWATPAAGGGGSLKFIQRSTFSNVANTSTTFDGVFTSTYKTYLINIEQIYGTNADDLYFNFRYAGPTTQSTDMIWGNMILTYAPSVTSAGDGSFTATKIQLSRNMGLVNYPDTGQFYVNQVGNTTERPTINGAINATYAGELTMANGFVDSARTYTGFILSSSSSNIYGTVSVYGLATS